uniref:Uncharacterized protein n=1 Tax=Rhizophora mucronata TaxID=61149 RepID=A0A2P2PXV7_RHIMU
MQKQFSMRQNNAEGLNVTATKIYQPFLQISA